LTLRLAKPKIDEWAMSVQEALAARMKQDGGKLGDRRDRRRHARRAGRAGRHRQRMLRGERQEELRRKTLTAIR